MSASQPVAVYGPAVVLNDAMVAEVWPAVWPAIEMAWAHWTPEQRERVRPWILAHRRAFDAVSTKGQIEDPVVPSAHDLSRTEAAAMLGVSKPRISQLLGAGHLEGARKVGGQWRIPASAVEQELDRRERGAA